MLRSAAFASKVVASMPIVLPRTRPCSANTDKIQANTNWCVSRSINLRVRRDRCLVWHRLIQCHSQKGPNSQRVRGPPCNPTLAIDAFEVSHHEQAEVHARRQAGPTETRRVKSPAGVLYKLVESALVQEPIEPLIERMTGWSRQHSGCDPKFLLPLPPEPRPHCHDQF